MCADAKLLVIDGLNIVRRIFEAIPVPEAAAKVEGALLSAKKSLARALKDHTPTHAIVVFDLQLPNWRHTLYPAYRSNRKPMPSELQAALPAFKDVLRNELGVLTLEAEGFEADDVIASLVAQWPGSEVVVLSNDKDLCALIPKGARIYNHFDESWRDSAWIQSKFNVTPEQLQDYLALTGDSVDGIPGVPKIGAKTAANLLREHGSLDRMLEAAQTSPDAKLKRIQEHRTVALLSRELVKLREDLKFGLSWKMARLSSLPS